MSDEPPGNSIGDHLHLGARIALSAIPGFGGPAVELFNRILAPPIQRRRDAWLTELATRVEKLEQDGRLNLEDLRNNDEFISTAMQASMVAVRNHQREKIEALRNAVLNTAVGQSLEDSKCGMFLTFVDTFTVWHLRVLQAMFEHDQSGKHWEVQTSIGRISEFTQKLIPQLRTQPALGEIVVDDLCGKGLLFWNREGGVTYLKRGTAQVTELGREFLRFISEPQETGTGKVS